MPGIHPRALLLGAALALAAPAPARADRPKKYDKTEDTVAGGTHWRIKTENGPVHVWIPPGYDRSTAGTVIYIHGYGPTVDDAWSGHRLARQFRASKQNAMFIVPEAPRGRDDRVYWSALADLKKAVGRSRIRIPDGPTVVIGHSGAFRTVSQWLDNRLLAQVILLDALYAREDEFATFIHGGKRARHHKLIILTTRTLEKSRSFARQFKYSVFRDQVPADYEGFKRHERGARLLFIRSQYDHMGMVTGGKVIPLLLRLTPLRRVGQAPRQEPVAENQPEPAAPPAAAPVPPQPAAASPPTSWGQ